MVPAGGSKPAGGSFTGATHSLKVKGWSNYYITGYLVNRYFKNINKDKSRNYKDQTDVVVGSDGSVVLVHGVRDDVSVLLISGDDVEVILAGNDAELVNSGTANTMGSVLNQ